MSSQNFQIFATFLSVFFVASHAVLPSEKYWVTTMQGVPIPARIKELMNPGWIDDWGVQNSEQNHIEEVCLFYNEPDCEASNVKGLYDSSIKLFFLENDLQLGKQQKFHFIKSSNRANFLPSKIADKIPFSSNKISLILDAFYVNSTSAEGKEIRNTITKCEARSIKGEEKSCVSTLESMIDFSTSKLGKNVDVLTSEVEEQTKAQTYSIVGLKNIKGDKVVACHKERYPYAVFNCHTSNIAAYKVSLVGEDGTKVKSIGVCHHDTSAWSPNHLAFQELNVKPGTVPICHFMPGDHIVWIPK
ncbi:hypothetical protein Leryth_011308 [Lithospermum erythrorhizon]|nr:hypothetical protein Leryth_011308 [Lithospermum erythrorhizon]